MLFRFFRKSIESKETTDAEEHTWTPLAQTNTSTALGDPIATVKRANTDFNVMRSSKRPKRSSENAEGNSETVGARERDIASGLQTVQDDAQPRFQSLTEKDVIEEYAPEELIAGRT